MSNLIVRKALEKRLLDLGPAAPTYPLVEAQMWFRGKAFNVRDMLKGAGGPGYYARPSYHPKDDRPMTMGPNPRVQKDGFFKIGLNFEPDMSEDPLDVLGDYLTKTVFPPGLGLTSGGLTVEISRSNRGDAFEVDGWLYAPVDVFWTLWRAT